MGYIQSIKTAIFIFPFIAFIFTLPFILHQYHKYGSIHKLRVLIIYSFILYLITIYFLVILPLPDINSVMAPTGNIVKLIPFSFINDFIRESSIVWNDPSTYLKALTEPCFYVVAFNILMTIPFGMYLRYYFKCSLKKVLLYSFLLSLFFEITQLTGLYFIYPYPYRLFDVDDLIQNTLGGVLGYLLMGALDNFLPTREEIDKEAIIDGTKVSGLRRITLFLLDIFIYLILVIIINIFTNKSMYVAFILYYILIPFINKGKTLGGAFLNVKLEFPNIRLLRLMLRAVFIYLYYFGMPYLFMFMITKLSNYLKLNDIEEIYLFLISIFIVMLFYLINIIIVWKNRVIYYDNIFKVKYVSTIKSEEEIIEIDEEESN